MSKRRTTVLTFELPGGRPSTLPLVLAQHIERLQTGHWRNRERDTVKYTQLGRSGLSVSRVGLGMMTYGDTSRREWHLGFDDARPIVRLAAESGITFFDTADMYDQGASEELTGRLLADAFPNREDYVLATKVYYPMGVGPNDRGLSRKHVFAAVDASLRRLGVDYIDLYQTHRWDPRTPVIEIMEALHDLVRAGKVRYLGASTMFAWQFATAQHVAREHGFTQFVSMQNLYNLVYREEEREMIPFCAETGVGVTPYSPLARGLLGGNRTRDGARATARSGGDPLADDQFEEGDFDVVDDLLAVALSRRLPPAQVAEAWLLGKAAVSSVLVGATRGEHIVDAVASAEVELSVDEVERLERSYVAHRLLGYE